MESTTRVDILFIFSSGGVIFVGLFHGRAIRTQNKLKHEGNISKVKQVQV